MLQDVTPETVAARIAETTAKFAAPTQRFQHLQFGEVELAPDQTGANKGRVKVSEVGDPTKFHFVKKADMQGRGNARMIPIKESATPVSSEQAAGELPTEAAPQVQSTASLPSPGIQQAHADWLSGHAYIKNGNYHVKTEGKSSGPIAPWNKEAKKLYANSKALGEAAHAGKTGAIESVSTERRKDTAERQRVADMTPEQMQKELLTSQVVDLPNKRAYEEAPKRAIQSRSDVDGLSWVNDNLSHEAGNELLKAKAQALKDEGVDAYHFSGDEFSHQFDTQEEADTKMAAVAARLAKARIVFTASDGTIHEVTGASFSTGVSTNERKAEAALQRNKAARAASGERASVKGARPPKLVEGTAGAGRTAEGRETESDTAAEVETPPKDKPLTLVFGGSLNPPHLGHVKIVKEAIAHAEAQGYTVAKVVVAPTAARLLHAKLGEGAYPLDLRTELSKLTFEGLPVEVNPAPSIEAENFKGKLRRTQLADWAARENPNTTVVNITGEDSAPGSPPAFPSIYSGDKGTNHEGYFYMALARAQDSISSSKIREALAAGKAVPKDLMHPGAEALLHESRKPVLTVPRDDTLSPEEQKIEGRFIDLIHKDTDGLIEEYKRRFINKAGVLEINVDKARELSPDYNESLASRSKYSRAVHEPASALAKEIYRRALAEPIQPGRETVIITGGGTGAGKSTALANVAQEHPEQFADVGIIFDTNSNAYESTLKKMDPALNSGRKIRMIGVFRDPVDALVNGALYRAEKKSGPDAGRTVPLKFSRRDAPRICRNDPRCCGPLRRQSERLNCYHRQYPWLG